MINDTIGKDLNNLAYIYGLSDFWTYIFEEPEKINLLLEGISMSSAAIYSRFLQLSSSISLEDIQAGIGYDLKHIEITVPQGHIGTKYELPSVIIGSAYIMDRPLLPTHTLTNDIDYFIEDEGVSIVFDKSLEEMTFARRPNADGSTTYSLWFSEVVIDEGLLQDNFGYLLNLDPRVASENYKNFLQGLYFLYATGPTIKNLELGFNLVVGVPATRQQEVYLDKRFYTETGRWMVITDLNSYVLPYGIEPDATFVTGQILPARTLLAKWVSVKDYKHDGVWWTNLYISPKLIPNIPGVDTGRYALPGSSTEYIMANFLKHHTFVVKIETLSIEDRSLLKEISTMIREARPTYTFPVYVWTIPTIQEEFSINDSDEFDTQRVMFGNDFISNDRNRFTRDEEEALFTRAGTPFIRWDFPEHLYHAMGFDYDEAYPQPIDGSTDTASGFYNATSFIADSSAQDSRQYKIQRAWARCLLSRSNPLFVRRRDHVMYMRHYDWEEEEQSQSTGLVDEINSLSIGNVPVQTTFTVTKKVHNHEGVGVDAVSPFFELEPGSVAIPMYITDTNQLTTALTALGLSIPTLNHKRVFKIKVGPPVPEGEVNEVDINTCSVNGTEELSTAGVPVLYVASSTGLEADRLSDNIRPNSFVPPLALRTNRIISTESTFTGYIVCHNILGRTWAVYRIKPHKFNITPLTVGAEHTRWESDVVTGEVAHTLPFMVVPDNDVIKLEYTAVPNRGMARSLSPMLLNRASTANYNDALNTSVPVGNRSGRASINQEMKS